MREWAWIRVTDSDTAAIDIVNRSDRAVPRIIRIRARDRRTDIEGQVANVFDNVTAIDENGGRIIVIIRVDHFPDATGINTDEDANLVSDADIRHTTGRTRLSDVGDHVVRTRIEVDGARVHDDEGVLRGIDFDDLPGLTGPFSADDPNDHSGAKVIQTIISIADRRDRVGDGRLRGFGTGVRSGHG
jgi:hypothetical protein